MFGRSNDTVQEAYNNLWGTDQGDDDFNNEQQRDDIFTLLSTSNDAPSTTTTSYNNAAKTTPTLPLPILTPPTAINSTLFNSRGNSSSISNDIKSEISNHPKRRSTSSQQSNIVTISPSNKISNQTSTTLDATVANGKRNSQRRKPSKLCDKQKSTDSNVQHDSKNSTNTALDNARRQMSTPMLSSSPLNPSTTPISSSTHVSLSNFLSTSNEDIESENDECTSNNIKLPASTKKFLLDLKMSENVHDNNPSIITGQSTLISLCGDNVKQNVEKLITGENIKPEIRKRKPYTKRGKSNDNVNTSKRKSKLDNQDDENLLKPNINSHSNMSTTSDISTTTATSSNAVSSSYTFRSIYYMCSNENCKLLVEHTCKQNYYDFRSLMGQLLNNDAKTVIESNMFVTIEPKKLHVCIYCSFSLYHSSCVLLENNANSISTHKLFCKHCNFTANYCTKHSQFCRIVEQSCTAVTLCSCECLNATHYCN